MSKVYDWLCVNNFSLNRNQTKHIIFHFYQYPDNRTLQINLEVDGIHIDKETIFNFLEFHIHDTLSWKLYVD